MASLNGQTIASSYEQLLHVDRDNGGNVGGNQGASPGSQGPGGSDEMGSF